MGTDAEPEANDELLSELNRLRADVARVPLLERRVSELERALMAGGADRRLTVVEFAERVKRSPATVRKWLKTPAERRRMRLEGLFAFDGGRLVTTEARVRRWSDLMTAKGPGR